MAATANGFLLGNENRGGLTINLQSGLTTTKYGHRLLFGTRRGTRRSSNPGIRAANYHELVISSVLLPSSRNLCRA